jgi:hypothetical protein
MDYVFFFFFNTLSYHVSESGAEDKYMDFECGLNLNSGYSICRTLGVS